MKLTDKIIQSAKIPSKGYLRLTDGDGLTLKITNSGFYFWNFRYQFNQLERNMSLGRYPAMSIRDARDEARQAKRTCAAADSIRDARDEVLELRYHLRKNRQAPNINCSLS